MFQGKKFLEERDDSLSKLFSGLYAICEIGFPWSFGLSGFEKFFYSLYVALHEVDIQPFERTLVLERKLRFLAFIFDGVVDQAVGLEKRHQATVSSFLFENM